MWLYPVPIGIGTELSGGDCYRELPRIPILGRSCIKKPGSYRSDPGSLRIDFGLLAVLAVHGADARALVREAEFLPAAFLALLLRRWCSWATLHREGCASCC